MATLALLFSPVRGTGRTMELENTSTTVLGRIGAFNTGDGQSSRQHAQVITDGDGDAVVVEIGSITGTFVNDARVVRAHLADRDQIRVGRCIFEIRTAFPRRCPTCRAAVARDRVVLPARRVMHWPANFLAYSCPSCHSVFRPGPRGGGRVEIAGALVLRTLERLKAAAEQGETDEWRAVEPPTLLGVPEVRELLSSSARFQP